MAMKTRRNSFDSSKVEGAEIDTRAPFESVKAAVSIFGERRAFSSKRLDVKKAIPVQSEGELVKETEKELNKLEDQLNNAETTRMEALAELDIARRTYQDLTHMLNAITESKESALKATEAAKSKTKHLEEVSFGDANAWDGAWKQELDRVMEDHAVAMDELDAAKKELLQIRKDFEMSLGGKISAFQQETEAKQLSSADEEKATRLSAELAEVKESLVLVKLATEQAKQQESNLISEKDAIQQHHKQLLEETESRLASLKEDFDPKNCKYLEAKLVGTTIEIAGVQKELEAAKASASELAKELEVLKTMTEEENHLRGMVECLKLELESVKKEHSELKEKDVENESILGNLQVQLQNCKDELEAALALESKAASTSNELVSALQQLSVESENAFQEAEALKKNAEELRSEAETTNIAMNEAEKKLEAALKDVEEAKAAEARGLDQIKALSKKANADSESTSESGASIKVSAEEYESLREKAEDSDKLAEMKVAAAVAQAEACRMNENEAMRQLEAAQKEIEDIKTAKEEAFKRAEIAEVAKKAMEEELSILRTESASILAETQISGKVSASRLKDIPVMEKAEEKPAAQKGHTSRWSILPNLNGLFHRRKSSIDDHQSASYLPGEKPL